MCLDYERKQIFILGRYLDASMRTAENLKVNKRLHYCLIFTLLPRADPEIFFPLGGRNNILMKDKTSHNFNKYGTTSL